MAAVVAGRMTAGIDGDFVVFIIGMRVNRWWKPHKWLPTARAMGRMQAELARAPECGCLAIENYFTTSVQYWRSFEHLEQYARSPSRAHWPAWLDFNRRVRAASGDVGIWHETFLVRAGDYETLYASMPRHGLARAGRHLPVGTGRESARERVGAPAASASVLRDLDRS